MANSSVAIPTPSVPSVVFATQVLFKLPSMTSHICHMLRCLLHQEPVQNSALAASISNDTKATHAALISPIDVDRHEWDWRALTSDELMKVMEAPAVPHILSTQVGKVQCALRYSTRLFRELGELSKAELAASFARIPQMLLTLKRCIDLQYTVIDPATGKRVILIARARNKDASYEPTLYKLAGGYAMSSHKKLLKQLRTTLSITSKLAFIEEGGMACKALTHMYELELEPGQLPTACLEQGVSCKAGRWLVVALDDALLEESATRYAHFPLALLEGIASSKDINLACVLCALAAMNHNTHDSEGSTLTLTYLLRLTGRREHARPQDTRALQELHASMNKLARMGVLSSLSLDYDGARFDEHNRIIQQTPEGEPVSESAPSAEDVETVDSRRLSKGRRQLGAWLHSKLTFRMLTGLIRPTASKPAPVKAAAVATASQCSKKKRRKKKH